MRVSLATEPANPAHGNEDFVVATPSAVVLLDGVGTPKGSTTGCVHGVVWFVQQLGITLLSLITEDDRATLTRCLAKAIKHVNWLHYNTCDLTHPGTPSATVVALRSRAESVDYLVLADSTLVLDLLGGVRAFTDDREAQVGQRLRPRMDSLPGGTREHEAAHREYVEALRSYRNTAGGFWAASTEPQAAAQAFSGSVPRTQVRAAALLSDGASRLVDRFKLVTWEEALKTLDAHGPWELIRQVRAAEDSDPRGQRWPRGKLYDDATIAYCWGFGQRQ